MIGVAQGFFGRVIREETENLPLRLKTSLQVINRVIIYSLLFSGDFSVF